ncbi:MAG: hypothetical protein JSW48_12620 [Betaproteobacteria bacterium]|jgi:hypothetical protein|nr:MAG: hypothetical protein JSW48_12620 [Betaproteobacteria bacterium]
MKREVREVRGIISLGTLLRVSVISGFAIGVMFGVFAGVVSFMARGNIGDLILYVVITPPVTALVLTFVTLIGHPLYAALTRAKMGGLDKIVYEVSAS